MKHKILDEMVNPLVKAKNKKILEGAVVYVLQQEFKR